MTKESKKVLKILSSVDIRVQQIRYASKAKTCAHAITSIHAGRKLVKNVEKRKEKSDHLSLANALGLVQQYKTSASIPKK